MTQSNTLDIIVTRRHPGTGWTPGTRIKATEAELRQRGVTAQYYRLAPGSAPGSAPAPGSNATPEAIANTSGKSSGNTSARASAKPSTPKTGKSSKSSASK